MKEEEKSNSPEHVYQLNKDKQRVVITGSQAKMITAIVVYVLNTFHREFDSVPTAKSGESEAPLLIIEAGEVPSLGYHHHIGVISEVRKGLEAVIQQFADATPKGGTLIFTETDPVGTIGKKERPGVTGIPYKVYPHLLENGGVVLVSSTNEKFPIRLNGEQSLRNISAAKEILKKLGITSGQFYRAIARFEA